MLIDAINLIDEFLNNIRTFFLILGPSSPDWLDQYCAGLTFGNQGSKMLVKFANLLIPVDKDGKRHKKNHPRHTTEEDLEKVPLVPKWKEAKKNPLDDIMAGVQ